MKKLILLISIVLAVTVTVNAQRVYTLDVDTLQGAETVNFEAISSSLAGTIAIQALCTETGGTSDGTLVLQGSVDGTSYVTLTETSGLFTFYPNDTLTITDGAVLQVVVQDSPFAYYRVQGAGTASDSTQVAIKYIPKK
jgi:hypothetical protein